MTLDTVQLGNLSVSRLILGGNPISGFSHQNPEKDREMEHYHTFGRIFQTLREAESLGITAHIARADHHVLRYLMEYWDTGGGIQWIAQTCPEVGDTKYCVERAIAHGASACFLHGGVMDNLVANGRTDEILPAIEAIRSAGLPAGVAGHDPAVFRWAEQHLDVDFYMCCYYNPQRRDEQAEHVAGAAEWFDSADRATMVDLIRSLSKPAIHFKVLAAGRTPPEEAFEFVGRHLRSNDAVCVGIHAKDHPNALADDAELVAGLTS